MKAIIVGAGEVGFNTAKLLSEEGHDVILIEPLEAVCRRCEEQIDLLTIQGNGASPVVLQEAGIQTADLFIAVSNHDEVNILACGIAKRFGVQTRIARVSNPDYFMEPTSLNADEFGIDFVINPELLCADEAYRLLRTAEAREIVTFAEGKVELVGFRVTKEMPIQGKPLIELRESGLVSSIRFVAVGRATKTIIPSGKDVVLPDDELYVIGSRDALVPFFAQIGIQFSRQLDRVVIAGAGRITHHLTQQLQRDGTQVRIVASNRELAESTKTLLNHTEVFYGETTDMSLLDDVGMERASAFAALTADDEDNLISCVYVNRMYHHVHTLTLVQKPRYVSIVAQMRSVGAAISPQLTAVNSILRFVRRGRIVSVASLREIDAEVMELVVEPGARVVGTSLQEAKFPRNAIIGTVIRRGEIIVPTGETVIQAADRVVLFSLPGAISSVEKLFAKR